VFRSPTRMFVLLPGLAAWLASQLFKLANGHKFWDSGGFPSSHTAFLAGLCSAVYITEGMTSVFWVSVAVLLVVVHDIKAFHGRHSWKDIVVGLFLGVLASVLLL